MELKEKKYISTGTITTAVTNLNPRTDWGCWMPLSHSISNVTSSLTVYQGIKKDQNSFLSLSWVSMLIKTTSVFNFIFRERAFLVTGGIIKN